MAQRLRAPKAPPPEDPGSSPVWLSAINTSTDQSVAIKNWKKIFIIEIIFLYKNNSVCFLTTKYFGATKYYLFV